MHKFILGIFFLFFCNFILAEETLLKQKPNIILILLDDLGYADLGIISGKENRTPHINQLARQGVLFRNHYTDTTCTPTRVGIMTGQHPSYYGFRPIHLGLPPDAKTLAHSLSSLGYETHHLGKWHIGNGSIHTEKYTPETVGFNTWFGFRNQFLLSGPTQDYIHYGKETYYDPWLEGNSQPLRQYRGHLDDIITQKAVELIKGKSDEKKPWFLNLWYFSPHSPFEPEKRFAEKYPDTDAGRRDALIEQIDSSIGRVLSALDRSGQARRTLVFLLSDNGGPFQENNQPFRGVKGQFYQGGIRTPLILRWPGHIPENITSDNLVSIFDIFTTVAAATGVSPPQNSNGRDLVSLTSKGLKQENRNILFWEYQNAGSAQFAVLSEDGHWQLVYDWNEKHPKLFDLYENPAGDVDVYEQNPAIADVLLGKFYQERLKSRVVNFNYERKSSDGHAILTGQETQRSPGYQGFTFGIAVVPEEKKTLSDLQIIAQQESLWRLAYEKNKGIQLTLADQKITGPELDANKCNSIVVTAEYSFTILRPDKNASVVELFVNGERVGSVTQQQPDRTSERFENPTLIGLELSGALSFTGKLKKPIILNERLVELERSEKLQNDINRFADQLCQDWMKH